MLSKKIVVNNAKFGRGLFASALIQQGEIVLTFEGPILHLKEGQRTFGEYTDDHAVQCGPNSWVNPQNEARFINHSCEPNCGIKNVFTLVALRDIELGEELTFDYAMIEDSWWKFQCGCGAPSCRKIISGYAALPQEKKEQYKGYISEWIVKKYENIS
ncbi:MAG: SET domain-containing protein-lysine N-methyltransferase [Parcubacteria group bacterium]